MHWTARTEQTDMCFQKNHHGVDWWHILERSLHCLRQKQRNLQADLCYMASFTHAA